MTWSWFCSFALLLTKKKKKDSMPEFDSSLLYLMLKCSYLAILKISSELIKLTQNTLLHENFISTSYWAKFKNTDGSWLQPEHPAGCFFYEYPHITRKKMFFHIILFKCRLNHSFSNACITARRLLYLQLKKGIPKIPKNKASKGFFW